MIHYWISGTIQGWFDQAWWNWNCAQENKRVVQEGNWRKAIAWIAKEGLDCIHRVICGYIYYATIKANVGPSGIGDDYGREYMDSVNLCHIV